MIKWVLAATLVCGTTAFMAELRDSTFIYDEG